jgi:transcriptional regulator with XRE-family HTH domain
MQIGTKVKKLRELKNFTQEHMAKHLDMTVSGFGKIERNESEVSYQKLEKIATILGIEVEDIVSFNEKLVFNVMHNTTGTLQNGYISNNGVSDKERELYEQIIDTQKEEIATLRNIIEKLQEK